VGGGYEGLGGGLRGVWAGLGGTRGFLGGWLGGARGLRRVGFGMGAGRQPPLPGLQGSVAARG
jgi:hypothetical protein